MPLEHHFRVQGTPDGSAAAAPSRAVLVMISLWLAAQIAIPTWQLSAYRPARWGWHMFAARGPAPRVFGVDSTGARTPLRLSDYVARYRSDIDIPDLFAAVARAACDDHGARLAGVEIVSRRAGDTTRVACRGAIIPHRP